MGLFSKLTKAKQTAPVDDAAILREQLAEISRDGRMHARTRLHDETLATLELPGGTRGRIVDLSYGGVAASFDKARLNLATSVPIVGTINILGLTVNARLTAVRIADQGASSLAGFCIHHELPASLLFLREFIEPSRCGETLGLIAPALRQDRYQGEGWHCWRGDGPADLIVQRSPGSNLINEAILTFRMGLAYCEVTWRQQVLKTGQTQTSLPAGALGAAAGIASNAELNPAIVRAALYILLASPPPCRDITAPLIKLLRSHTAP